jgi:hypothetical protein
MYNMTTDKTHPDSWYVTFGLGTPNGSTYSEILVDRKTASLWTSEEITHRVENAVRARYGNDFAFIYWPHEKYRATLRATLRERIDLNGEVVKPSDEMVREALADAGRVEFVVIGRNGHRVTLGYDIGAHEQAEIQTVNEIHRQEYRSGWPWEEPTVHHEPIPLGRTFGMTVETKTVRVPEVRD